MNGYRSKEYAHSLSEFGKPIQLENCGGWILKRRIPGTDLFDSMGLYPIFSCKDMKNIHLDIDRLKENGIISLSMVTDPFMDISPRYLKEQFPDVCYRYKYHYYIDLSIPVEKSACSHHRRYYRKGIKAVNVERCEDPRQHLEEWNRLYGMLIEKHKITGMKAFSKKTFEKLFNVPGLDLYRALCMGETVGMVITITQGDTVYYHLGACNDRGYDTCSSYAIFHHLIENLKGKRIFNLGSGAGVRHDESDGLTRFKKGWTSLKKPAYFCGIVLDREGFHEVLKKKKPENTEYFPPYREGEFG